MKTTNNSDSTLLEGGKLDWTGERFVPWVDKPSIHYEHLHRYAFASQFVENKTVLDLGCGEGYGAYMCAKTAKHVIAVDVDEVSVRHAQGKYRSDNLEFIVGDLRALPFGDNGVFDVIICYEVLEHIVEHNVLLTQAKSLLKENGILIISTPNKSVYTDDPEKQNHFHLKELYFHEFEDLLKTHFKEVAYYGQRIFATSNIWPIYNESDNLSELIVEKALEGFSFCEKDKKVGRFFIAVASDYPVENRENSFFVDSSNNMTQYYEKTISELASSKKDKIEMIQSLMTQLKRARERPFRNLASYFKRRILG